MLFFFGTLMDPAVRAIVLGEAEPDGNVRRGRALGFRRVFVPGRSYPMLRPHPAGRVEGILVDGISPLGLRRLEIYEGPEYRLVALTVEDGTGNRVEAKAFLCPPGLAPGRRPWTFASWRRRHGRKCLREAAALMGSYGIRRALRRPLAGPGC